MGKLMRLVFAIVIFICGGIETSKSETYKDHKQISALINEYRVKFGHDFKLATKDIEQKLYGKWQVENTLGYSLKFSVTGGSLDDGKLELAKNIFSITKRQSVFKEIGGKYRTTGALKDSVDYFHNPVFAYYQETLNKMKKDEFLDNYSGIYDLDADTLGTVIVAMGLSSDSQDAYEYIAIKFIIIDDYVIAIHQSTFFQLQRIDNSNFDLPPIQQNDDIITQAEQIYYSNHKISISHDLTFASGELYEIIEKAYSQIEFLGEFRKANVENYDLYKNQYIKLFKRESTIIEKETNEEFYIDEFYELEGIDDFANNPSKLMFHFFDVDEDEEQELIVSHKERGFFYIIKYDISSEKFILWCKINSGHTTLISNKKTSCTIPDFRFYQLDEYGDIEYRLSFYQYGYYDKVYRQYRDVYLVSLPRFSDENRNIKLPENIKYQTYIEYGTVYFRVSENQYDTLTKNFFEARKLTQKNIDEVNFTYEELFGL